MKLFTSNAVVLMVLVLQGALLGGCASQSIVAEEPEAVVSSAPPSSGFALPYECQQGFVVGLPAAGQGDFGCHFILRHPETGKKLAYTPYRLDVFDSPEHRVPIASIDGVTDGQGRSGFVSAAVPIVPEQVRFVEVIGKGPYGRAPRLAEPKDERGTAKVSYRIDGCGRRYKGVTNDQGYGVMVKSPRPCKIKVNYYVEETAPPSKPKKTAVATKIKPNTKASASSKRLPASKALEKKAPKENKRATSTVNKQS